jgi:AbiTii
MTFRTPALSLASGHAHTLANGVWLGRKPTLTYHQREAIKRRDHGEETLGEIARLLQCEWLDDFEVYAVTMPLILQIQEAVLDSKSSVTDALRKAKIACAKLGLTDFGNWIELELNGYTEMDELPKYRMLYGRPQGYNPVRGWQPIMISGAADEHMLSLASIGMTISSIEESLRDAKSDSTFGFPYPNEIQQELSNSLNLKGIAVRIQLSAHQAADIAHAVRN